MRGTPLFALALVALLSLGAPIAAAATPAAEPTVDVNFKLDPDHGLHAHLESSGEEVTLELARRGRRVSYEVHGETTEAGLRARFGKLGLIDVAFEPIATLATNEPPKGCQGDPRVRREGAFVGTIEFHGERDFVRIAMPRATGVMRVISEWRCRRKGPIRLHGPARRSISSFRPGSGEEDTATLAIFNKRCRCGLAAFTARNRYGRGPTIFYGVKGERREGMEIERVTFGHAAPAAFAFDHAAGTATVRPPAPFSGHGIFERRAHGRDRWESTLRVPLLGSSPLDLGGRGFRVSLQRAYPSD